MNHVIDDSGGSASVDGARSLTERAGPLLLIAAVVFAVDQLSKAVIRGWLAVGEHWPANFELIRFGHVENTGAAFGILQGAGPLLIVTTSVAIVLIAITMLRVQTYSRPYLYALALILGGAVGNLTDRLARGAVTDFIDPTRYPSFNIADSAIVIGVAAILLLTLFDSSDDDDETQSTSEPRAE